MVTCLEKLKELNPNWDESKLNKYTKDCCPHHMYIAHDPIWCMKTYDCKKCWDRTLKNYEHCNEYEFSVKLDGADMRRLKRLCDGSRPANSVISSALYFLEQSLLYDPSWISMKEEDMNDQG